jgi:hypothetical protein
MDMAYIWINPVVTSMYEPEALDEFLEKHGYKQVKTSEDWLRIVKGKYHAAVNEAKGPVMDMRCPKSREVVEAAGVVSEVTFPTIEPILIHCAREISARADLRGEEKVITTPCHALADMGNALKLLDTTFVTWNQFLANLNDRPEKEENTLPVRPLKSSPIPPGFFDSLVLETKSLTGEDEIREYFQTHFANSVSSDVQLVEMLFCKHGCHNGDGICG